MVGTLTTFISLFCCGVVVGIQLERSWPMGPKLERKILEPGDVLGSNLRVKYEEFSTPAGGGYGTVTILENGSVKQFQTVWMLEQRKR